MPLDPQFQALMANVSAMPPLRTLTPEHLRAIVRQYADVMPKLDVPLQINDRSITGPCGALPIRIYTPQGKGPFPVLVYFHGGGWVVGDLETQDVICRGISFSATCIVVSVDYRLAPEHKFPAAADDAYAATRWVAANAVEFNGDPQRLAVGGDSAGAILAGGVALRIREEGGPALRGQVLFYGSMDYELSGERTGSLLEFAEGPLLSTDDIEFYWSHYLRNFDTDLKNPYAAPLRATHHRNLPAAFVGTAECDPTRDSAEAYAAKLKEAGVAVEMHRYIGMPHGFVSWLGLVDGAQQAVDDASAWLKKQFD